MLFASGVPAYTTLASTDFGWLNYSVLIVYLLLMVGIGFWCSRHNRDTNDFFRGGQRIPWWAAGFSIFATMLSSITFMAIPAVAYGDDWYLFLANSYILITPVVIFVFLPFYRRLNITSAYEYLEKRFNLGARMVASGLFVLFQTGRIAIVLYLPALALSTVSSIDLTASILLMGVLCIIYTMMGGIEAVIWTDVVQTLVLLGGALFSLYLIVSRLDMGGAEMVAIGRESGKFFENVDWSWDLMSGTAWTILLGSLFHNMFSYTASQDVVQRYITTKDEKTAARAIWLNAVLSMPAQAVFFAIGTALFVFYKFNPGDLQSGLSNDAIFPYFIVNEVPAGVAGLIVAGLFAAAQSSASSSMNSVATALVTDFHRRLKPRSSEDFNLLLARILTLITGTAGVALALVVAAANLRSALETYLNIIGLFGGTISGLFILGIVFSRANGPGAIAGALISAVAVFLVRDYVHFYAYAFVGIFTTVTAGLLFSLVTERQDRSRLEGLTLGK